MDSRRLVVWISTGILGFQGATLAFDLLNCTALSWLYVRTHGLPAVERPMARLDSPGTLMGSDPAERPSSKASEENPLPLFCASSQGRINEAVKQGLAILAGLAFGSSVNGPTQGDH
jgi:hypothetical protein